MVNHRTKPGQEKCGKVNWPARHDLNNADWAFKLQTNQPFLNTIVFDENLMFSTALEKKIMKMNIFHMFWVHIRSGSHMITP